MTWEEVGRYRILGVVSFGGMGMSWGIGWMGWKWFGMPKWIIASCVFNNAVSLPLLLLNSLAASGSLDQLIWGETDTIAEALSRGRTYILVGTTFLYLTTPSPLTPYHRSTRWEQTLLDSLSVLHYCQLDPPPHLLPSTPVTPRPTTLPRSLPHLKRIPRLHFPYQDPDQNARGCTGRGDR